MALQRCDDDKERLMVGDLVKQVAHNYWGYTEN